MNAAILDAVGDGNAVRPVLEKVLAQRDVRVSSFDLKKQNIKPCRSCGACGIRTPGLCVQKDDMEPILRSIAQSYWLVYITPIRFGGFSYELKKALDRIMPVGLPFYMVRKGHLLHPMRYGRKSILAVGLSEPDKAEEEANFRLLVSRNGLNMQYCYETVILYPDDGMAAIEKKISQAIIGGGQNG